jgi:hypothetical protein
MRESRFEYKGYTYQPEHEIEADGDNAKIYHSLVNTQGKLISIDFTPYSYMTEEDFRLYIDLGMPKRLVKNNFSSALNSEALREIETLRSFEILANTQ